jgi:phosphatidylserine/phosphatidylglycerophosphate/cardiolipin synthase-like enzyme/uncharacterized membrane protein YdjX (TVP38/TMEM64 family)
VKPEAPVAAIASEGRNCWRRARARRVAFLVDGEAYFAAVAEAVERAERSVLILAWDIHSGVSLRRDGGPHELPTELGSLLRAVLDRRPALHVHVLDWNFAMLYALEREPLPRLRAAWRRHPRLHFQLDGDHPVGASHHQKIVVVDDAVAFVGGFDLALSRWDSRTHAAEEPRRRNQGGRPYGPFHDVQMMVDGEAARVLGELARERWRRATREILAAVEGEHDPWPPRVAPELWDVTVAIARTDPAWRGRPAVREVEALFVDMLSVARRSIYIEQQYLTSTRVADVLESRLRTAGCPEIVIVVPLHCSGWLEEATMGVLRRRLLERLRAADRFGRLHVFHPTVPGGPAVNVHDKVLIVDDVVLRVGSANMSNRSMGLDTECDLAIEAEDRPHVAAAIVRFRNDLVAEHLGVPADAVAGAIASHRSLAAAVEALRGDGRTLQPLGAQAPSWTDDLVPDALLIDPEGPLTPLDVVQEPLFGTITVRGRPPLLQGALVLLALSALVIGLRSEDVGDSISAVAEWAAPWRSSPITPLLVIGVFVTGGLLLVPVSAMVVVTVLALGPVRGAAYALLATLAAAAAAFAAGRLLRRRSPLWSVRSRTGRIAARLVRRALGAVSKGRLAAIAPLTAICLSAGAAEVSVSDFARRAIATLVPALAVVAVITDRLLATVRAPRTATVTGALFLLALLVLTGRWVLEQLHPHR